MIKSQSFREHMPLDCNVTHLGKQSGYRVLDLGISLPLGQSLTMSEKVRLWLTIFLKGMPNLKKSECSGIIKNAIFSLLLPEP